MPVGFIATQLESARAINQRWDRRALPSGFVTMLMTDIEGSTALVHHLGARYGSLIEDLCTILRQSAARRGLRGRSPRG